MAEIEHLIANVGFPIAACLYMMYTNNQMTKAITQLELVVQKNTDVILSLKGQIAGGNKDGV